MYVVPFDVYRRYNSAFIIEHIITIDVEIANQMIAWFSAVLAVFFSLCIFIWLFLYPVCYKFPITGSIRMRCRSRCSVSIHTHTLYQFVVLFGVVIVGNHQRLFESVVSNVAECVLLLLLWIRVTFELLPFLPFCCCCYFLCSALSPITQLRTIRQILFWS